MSGQRAAYQSAVSIAALISGWVVASSANAQSAGGADTSGAIALPAIEIYATSADAATPTKTDLSPAASAQPANATVVTSQEIRQEPVVTYGDIFRPLAGFNVSGYSQGIIGYGIALRGFTEQEHGRDISYVIDGVPINEVSSQHTPNYADLNPLIPETVDHIDIIRGPFSVEYGDSNIGGSVNIVTKRAEPFAYAGIYGGSFGTLRSLATYSSIGEPYSPYIAFDAYRSQGIGGNSELERLNSFNKITIPLENGADVSIRAQVHGARGNAPGYINRGELAAGILNDRSVVNPTDGSTKLEENLVVNYRMGVLDQELSGTVYVNHDTFDRFSDFGGGQTAQLEDRTTTGGTIRKVFTTTLLGIPTQFLTGANLRTDFINALQAPSTARRPDFAARSIDLGITETNLAGFEQVQVKPFTWVKLTGGVRFDQFFYTVNNHLDPTNSPNANPNVVSPKGGIAITPFDWLELYGNYGEGFRSPNATNDLLSNPNLKPLKLSSEEVGGKFIFDRATFQADVWQTDIANEIFQAAPGLPFQNLGRSRRRGIDLEGHLYAIKDPDFLLSFFANYSPVDARLLAQTDPTAIHVPGVPVSLLNLGMDFDRLMGSGDHLTGSAYVTFVGKKFLSEDNVLTTSPYSRVSGKLAYNWQNGWSAFVQATYYPGSTISEVAFNFGNNTGATSADAFVRPLPRLTLLAGVNYRFATTGP